MPVGRGKASALSKIPASLDATVIPMSRRARLIASPMPRVPPVTIATLVMAIPLPQMHVPGPYERDHQPDSSRPMSLPYIRIASSSAFRQGRQRSEEHTSELQSLMRNSFAVLCLKKKQEQIN